MPIMAGEHRKVAFGMKKSNLILLCTTVFSIGIILGFLLAPIKKGISIGNHSGNKFRDDYNDKFDYDYCGI